ncbi:asparagine synthase (glutamine-hydrolyzing) [Hydrogenophaga sp.]|uniref:asparagine synthase (glutamine-hydrolyzing) n=1 Tax=Hydrogenophaga sp. TaxID=1904254 RepID=UPI002719469C|nr:asparagine synthase (glutamine-hydrolyzing) [Hydrogenophaga sp.]MDO9135092.1 asparagine synthase (glutamine-hydrolyzing) [Hydrogenophaga sp.]MDO9604126.1 asparagine synthase (glutamine-hydrolyzing) [Hydrogenophaga sp.]MDP2166090.1 asparagine synthase (glutamine-hydrolyzing) [Hydrogenophaga sp.]MDP3476653.1 asparagine synthase (glutamine-hydrolyzing) [Hydrogenophaga sp.]
MCGIFGYWDRKQQALADEALHGMAQALIHRGPDDEGIHCRPARGVAIGNRRLSIIDLGGGHQPFVSDDGQIAVVQNGEIFNHIELAAELRAQGVRLDTQSDTEVILRLYEREGIACLQRLNGMFAMAIDDARADALYLARDRIGVKPLYVHDDGQRMVFGSEMKALWPAVRRKPGMDLEAIHHYLTFNYVPAPWTAFEGVRHVMPGTWQKYTRSGGVQTQRWWNLADQREQDHTFGAWAEAFMALLDDATRIRLRADVPFGAFLSGGVDSSTIVGLMARHVTEPVKTFCIGFADPRYDESAFALQAAQRFGCAHTSEVAELNMLDRWPLVLHHLDQPHGDASFMPTLRVSELAAKHVKVVLTGDGGDELFAGYDKYAQFFARPDALSLPQNDFERSYSDSISLFSPEAKATLYRPGVRAQLGGMDSFTAAAKPWFNEARHFDRINQALYLDMQLLLSGNNLVKPDRMGMAVSIEARTPFLDWRMMEFAFRSRGATKLSAQGDKKHWFKRAVVPLIGEDLAHRKKQMFTVPVGDWFKGELHGWLRQTLTGGEVIARLFEPAGVTRLLDEHRDGRCNHTRELRALAALALWHRDAFA